MGAHYSASMLTTSTTTIQYATIATVRGSTAQRSRIKRIEIYTDDATAGAIGLAWSTAASSGTRTNGGTFTAHDGNDATATAETVVSAATALATNGGVGTVFRRFSHTNVAGAGVIWGESELGPLELATGGTAARGELCFVQLKTTAPAKYHINIVAENVV